MAQSHDLVVDGRVRVPVEVVSGLRARHRGLLGRDGIAGALWLQPCRQVHTFGMRFAIDVAYVDRRGRVLAVHRMQPGRLGRPHLRARAVVEVEAGAFVAWDLAPGSAVRVEQAGPEVARRR